ncbi:hypothetical protein L7F22_024585 [Adiantum nelumboides]|nr:hypothetical protein [Adiantum nelumboides]
MKKDCGDNVDALRVFEGLVDIEIILGIPCVLPLLERMHMLVKLSQAQDVYVLDFVECIENTKKVLKEMYDLQLGFQGPKFKMWTSLVYGSKSDSWLDFNEKDELGIVLNNTFIIVKGGFEGQGVRHSRREGVSNNVFLETIEHVKRECHAAAIFLVQEINDRFPSHALVEAFSIIYPQFWYSLTYEEDFLRHLKTLQATYCTQREVGGCFYGPILDAEKLDSQSSFFTTTMKAHVAKTPMEYAKEVTVTFLWKKLSQVPQLLFQIFEYAKLADLALVIIIDSVKDERTFSRLDFIKNKKRNILDKHLDICGRAFEQNLYDINTFPFNEACNVWNDCPMRTRRDGAIRKRPGGRGGNGGQGHAASTVHRLLPDLLLPDIIVVPGGPGTVGALKDPVFMDWLKKAHETSAYTTSVCSGSLALAAAGLLQGLEASSHWSCYDDLAKLGAVPTEERVVQQSIAHTSELVCRSELMKNADLMGLLWLKNRALRGSVAAKRRFEGTALAEKPRSNGAAAGEKLRYELMKNADLMGVLLLKNAP